MSQIDAPPANPNGAWSYGEYLSGSFVNLAYTNGAYYYNGTAQDGGFIYMNTGSGLAYGIEPGQVSVESDWGTAVAR